MAAFKANEEARLNRLASMTDSRPESDSVAPSSRVNQFQGRVQLRDACLIRVDRIEADPDQPRAEFDAESLERLAASLKQRGQLQPIRVRWDEANSRYMVIVGERRWRAARLAGLESLACVVVPGDATPEEILEDQLVENCLRVDLRPVEQARAYQSLMQRLGISQRTLADKLNVSQGQVMQSLKLLELPEPIKQSIEEGKIAPTVGYELTKVDDPAEQASLARGAAAGLLRRDEIKERAKARRTAPSKGKGRGARLPAEMKHRGPNGSRVTIQTTAKQTMADIVADLRAIADRLDQEASASAQDAA
jgi:ParB family transcriptional regulator, chromosome partitioning protein